MHYKNFLIVLVATLGLSGARAHALDCNGNGVSDDLDILGGTSADCQPNGIPDECDIAGGTSSDCNSAGAGNGVPDECEAIELTADDGVSTDHFGQSVSVHGDTAVIGAHFNNGGRGAAYVFRRIGGSWQQIAKLTAADPEDLDYLGESVSVYGDTAVIGAWGDDNPVFYAGSAYVFREVGGAWQQIAKLTAADAGVLDQFGRSVSISGDTAVIAAPCGDADGVADSGAAYVFREVGGVWQQIAKLTALDAAYGVLFGWSVSLSGDTAVIGARWDGTYCQGSAYVFREVGGVWQQIAKLTAADALD